MVQKHVSYYRDIQTHTLKLFLFILVDDDSNIMFIQKQNPVSLG